MSSDFDRRVRELLHDAADALPSDAGLAVRIEQATVRTIQPRQATVETPRRRRALLPVIASATVIAVVVAVILVATLDHGSKHSLPATPIPTVIHTPVPTPSMTPTPSPTSTPTPSSTTRAPVGPVGAAVPAGFAATGVQFVNPQLGFAIGDAPCTAVSGNCPALVRTRDGGVHWVSIPLPANLVAPRHQVNGPACYDKNCVETLQFADELHGYLWSPAGGGNLYVTGDGGTTWAATGGAFALTIAGGSAIREYLPGNGQPAEFSVAALGSTQWHTTHPDPQPFVGQFATDGSRVYLAGARAAGTGSLAHTAATDLYRSDDGGNTWHDVLATPCPTTRNIEAPTVTVAADHTVVLQCFYINGAAGYITVRTSTDGGQTFGEAQTITATQFDLTRPGAARPAIALFAASATELTAAIITYSSPTSYPMEHSGDGGRTWHTLPTHGWISGGFTPEAFGYALTSDRTGLLTSTDAGATWTPTAFR